MTPYSAFFDDCLPELPGADLAVVLHHIKRTCNDWYESSQYAREDATPIDILNTTNTYVVPPLDTVNFQVNRIMEVRINDGSSGAPRKVTPRTRHVLNIELPNWDVQTGTPIYYTQTAINNVLLAWFPDTGYPAGLLVNYSKVPQYSGGGIDDFIFGKFNEDIAYGAKARMMRMTRKPWSDPQGALAYEQRYNLGVAGATAIAAKSFGAGPLRSRAYG